MLITSSYYKTVHSTYPLLPGSKARLPSSLSICPPVLREAFCESLYLAVRSFPTSNLPNTGHQGTKKAEQVLTLPFDADGGITNLVHLQTLLFMAIEADNHGPGAKGQAIWLGAAVGFA